MKENIFSIIEGGSITVRHNDTELSFNLPSWLTEASGSLEEEEGLLSWAQNNEILLPLMQKGLQALVIDLRACIRPSDKTIGKVKTVFPLTQEEGQARLDEYVLTNVRRTGAGAGTVKVDKVRQLMIESGMSDEQIDQVLGKL